MTDTPPTDDVYAVTQADRRMLRHHEQMADAQSGCVPCKLCGGKAIISDAGPGAGYYIACENGNERKGRGCLINERRVSGWAYNVSDWWNRLHRLSDHSEQERTIARLRDALERYSPYLRHSQLCGIVGGYGYCTCGLDEVSATLNGEDWK